MRFSPTAKIAIKLFLITFLIYILSWALVYATGVNRTVIPSEDALPATFLPVSIVNTHNFYLDELAPYLISKYPNQDDKTAVPFYLRYINGHYVSGFPVVGPLLAVPVYLIPVLFLRPEASSPLIPILGKVSAGLMVSLSVVFVFLVALEFLEKRKALLVSLVYGLATSTFAISSQGMWQHGPTQLLLVMSLWLLVTTYREERLLPLSGLFLSLACLTRPTAFVPASLFALYVFLKHRRQFVPFIIFSLLPLIPWLWYNQVYFGSMFQHAYNTGVGTEGNWTGSFPEGFLGLWVSPSKGLLIYSPVLIFSIWGMIRVFRDIRVMGDKTLLWRFLALSVVAYTLLMGRWYHWFGGWSFSYRMAVDVIPYLVLLMVPVLLTDWSNTVKRVFMGLFALSLSIQIVGITFFDGEWHARFDKGPNDTRWLWSVKDSELVYYGRKTVCRIKSKTTKEYRECQGFYGESTK